MEKVEKILDSIIDKTKLVLNFIYKYRFIIIAVTFILCVFFEISGSSIGCWNDYINLVPKDTEVKVGHSRGIRSDEWAVLTPMFFSQVKNGFNYFNTSIRATNTDVFMVYALPVANIVQIFRPFEIGFLFLGAAKGLSFFWCSRLICLFLVSFELAMILTKKDKVLSTVYAVLVTLSPVIQWWFAINGIAEIFIFGQLAVIMLYKFMNTEVFWKRCTELLTLIVCAGGYILVLYPAWQVPMVYAFAALAIWVFIENRKNCKIRIKDICAIIVALLIFALCMGYIFMMSKDTISAVMNTVYPGSRFETGGNTINEIFNYAMNIFFSRNDSIDGSNVCVKSAMFTLFPLGLILAVYTMIKQRKKDVLLIALLVAYFILGAWCIVGFPDFLAKISLLSFSPANRSMLALGFLDVLILFRAIANMKEPIGRKAAFILAENLAIAVSLLCLNMNSGYITEFKMLIEIFVVCMYLFYFACRYKAKYSRYLFAIGLIFIMVYTGALVNPIRSGAKLIDDSPILAEVEKIDSEDKGIWISEGLGFPYQNYIMMAGVQTVNCTNTYPVLDRWRKIDVENKYEAIYNRYAHIIIRLVKDETEYENKFNLMSLDSFDVNLTVDELETLNVKYIFTVNELESYNTDNIKFEKIYVYNNFMIYKVNKAI